MKVIWKSHTLLLGKPVSCLVIKLDEGISVTLAGGDRSHIGSVSLIGEDGVMHTHTFPGHKETIISERWAEEIYAKKTETVEVSVGIHYDRISPENIGYVLAFSEELLQQVLEKLDEECARA